MAGKSPSEDTAFEVKIEGYAGPDVQSTKEQHCRPRKQLVQRLFGRKGLGLF